MGDLLRRAVSVKKKKKTQNQSSNKSNKTMPSATVTSTTVAAATDRQTATVNTSSGNNNNININNNNMAEERSASQSTARSRFSSISSKATSSEDNLFSSSFESNTSSFLDANDQRPDEAAIQIFYDSCDDSDPSPPTDSTPKSDHVEDDHLHKVDIVVDEDLSASDLSDHLTIKLSLKGRRHLVAQVPSLNIQRVIQDDEEVLPLVVSGHHRSHLSDSDPSPSLVSTSTTGKSCQKSHHRRSSVTRHGHEKFISSHQSKGDTGTLRAEDQTVKQSLSQETVREVSDVRILMQKAPACKYAFMDRPQDFMCLNMIEITKQGSDTSQQEAVPEDIAIDASSKVVLLQEMIRFGRETPNLSLTVRGQLTYNKRQVMAEINLTGKTCQDFFLLKCKSMKCVNPESDRLFLCSLYDVYTPIHDEDDDDDDAVIETPAGAEKSEEKRAKGFRFALCRTGDTESEPVHWFSCKTEEERTCWLTCMQMLKYGLKNLRQKAKSHAKHFPPAYDIVLPASYNEMSNQQQVPADPGTEAGNESSGTKSDQPHGRRSRDETAVSLMMKKHSPEYEPWFYPNISREEAAASLTKYSSVDGVFLVRASQRTLGSFVLSFVASGKVNHVTIQNVDADHGQVVVSLDWGVTKFYDLKQLIEFYQLNQGSLPTRLTHFLVHK